MKFNTLLEKIIETIQHWQELGLVNAGHYIYKATNQIDGFIQEGEYTVPQEVYMQRARTFFETILEIDGAPSLEIIDESNFIIAASAKLV